MARVKHQSTICVQIDGVSDSSDSNTDSVRSKSRKKKKKRKRTSSESDSPSHDASSSESSDAADSESKVEDQRTAMSSANERDFGFDLDLFDRACSAKKAYSKRNSKPI